MTERLTDRSIKTIKPPAKGSRITYDGGVKGFGIRTTAAGSKAFVLRFRRKSDGLERTLTIGQFPSWSTSTARQEAARLKREIDGGADPVGEHQSNRAAPTVNDLCDRFVADYLPRKRASTQRDYRQQIDGEIRPALGRLKVASLSFADIDGLHRKISERAPYRANRVVATLSMMSSMAVRWAMRETNPCRGVERNQEQKRKRYLTPGELVRLSEALDRHRDQQSADIIRLLLLTGSRRGETLQARWDDIDLETGKWRKPGATTKQKTVHEVPLSDAAAQLLRKVRQRVPTGTPWVFPASDGGHRRDAKSAWAKLCRSANISGVRLHDLRHSYASILASAGLSLPIIGQLLGHTTANTTLRYSHLVDDALRAATNVAGAVITGNPSAEVVPLKGRRRER